MLTFAKRFISEGAELNEQRDGYRKRTVFSDDILKFVCKIADGLSDKFAPTGGENKWKDKETAVLDLLNMLETRYNLNFNELENKFQEKNKPQE